MANAGKGVDEGYAEGGELLGGTDTGVKEEARSVDCASAEDGFSAGMESEVGTGLEDYVDASDGRF